MKKEIRDIYKVDNHSVYIHDTYEDGIRIAKTLLNKNSIDFLEQKKGRMTANNEKFLLEYYNYIKNKDDTESYCIDSSFVMALYGLREAKDLDYLTLDEGCKFKSSNVECHNDWVHHYTVQMEDIINIPDNHFYYGGMKVATLGVVKKMKEKREVIN
jgi:hypothetical protein